MSNDLADQFAEAREAYHKIGEELYKSLIGKVIARVKKPENINDLHKTECSCEFKLERPLEKSIDNDPYGRYVRLVPHKICNRCANELAKNTTLADLLNALKNGSAKISTIGTVEATEELNDPTQI